VIKDGDAMSIGKSREDYLESILIQIKQYGACRLTDVASEMGVSKPSTSVAIKKLEEEGYVLRDDWRILLTESGTEIATRMYDRHTFFTDLFVEMGIDKEKAMEEACLIEHSISDDSFEKIKNYALKKGIVPKK